MAKRVLFLSDIDSAHTQKWATSLHERGYEVAIFSLRKSTSGWFYKFPAIQVFGGAGFSPEMFHSGTFNKLAYLKALPALRTFMDTFKPDLVHAHYATSYGLLGVRSGFHPLIISVWGSDVFDFPRKSPLHRMLVKRNLRKADAVFSTSAVMKTEVEKLGRTDAHVTPFGVDTSVFFPNRISPMFSADTKVIGTIKTLEAHYGIDVLIRAFEAVKSNYSGNLKLVICGSGTQEVELKTIAAGTSCRSDIVFTGRIKQEDVPKYLNQFDVFANLSVQESFGVAVVEAMACGVPVVTSDAGGLLEVTAGGTTGLVVPVGDVSSAAEAITRLIDAPDFAAEMGEKGRRHAQLRYDWKKNLDDIEALYDKLVFHQHGTKS